MAGTSEVRGFTAPPTSSFSANQPIYLVVWKPLEGPGQGFVEEWIKLVLHRQPDAYIFVVATHGGPKERQPDIDEEDIRKKFGEDRILGFFHVENKPDKDGKREGFEKLRTAIGKAASKLPHRERKVPLSFKLILTRLKGLQRAYVRHDEVTHLFEDFDLNAREARLMFNTFHQLGHVIYYGRHPELQDYDIVILKPDWLSTAISYVLDDANTRKRGGLVRFSDLNALWQDPERDFQYPFELHDVFLGVMEQFKLSYRVETHEEENSTHLIAQLVPQKNPEERLQQVWYNAFREEERQQVQICRIVDRINNESAIAEGLFFQLIVRLHTYSLGLEDYTQSVHWRKGLVLDNGHNGRALLEHIGNNIHITVSAIYPEVFVGILTDRVIHLVNRFWKGLECQVMVPCIIPCGKNEPGTGLYEVKRLIESIGLSHSQYPCPRCNTWQDITKLLQNSPAAHPSPVKEVVDNQKKMHDQLSILIEKNDTLIEQFDDFSKLSMQSQNQVINKLDDLKDSDREILSKIDDVYNKIIRYFTDEARDGPRLFSFDVVERSAFNPRTWTTHEFKLTLWCEHSRLPVPMLNRGTDYKGGVYTVRLSRSWFKKAAPLLKVLTGTLSPGSSRSLFFLENPH